MVPLRPRGRRWRGCLGGPKSELFWGGHMRPGGRTGFKMGRRRSKRAVLLSSRCVFESVTSSAGTDRKYLFAKGSPQVRDSLSDLTQEYHAVAPQRRDYHAPAFGAQHYVQTPRPSDASRAQSSSFLGELYRQIECRNTFLTFKPLRKLL